MTLKTLNSCAFLIWAVVGVHLAYLGLNSHPGFDWLVGWSSGWQAVEMFFLMSGFFLFYHVNTQESVLHFALRKWLRLAPFIVVLTLAGYLLAGFDILQYPLSVNIFNSLLLLDWNTHHFGPDATIIYVAWFANVLFFVSVLYFCILKALPREQATLVIGLISLLTLFMYNRHLYIIVPFIYPLVRALSYMGFGYLLCLLWKAREQARAGRNCDLKVSAPRCYLLISCLEALLLGAIFISLFAGSSGGSAAPGDLEIPVDEIASLTALTWFPAQTRWALGGVWLQLCFAALFWLFLCRQGVISRLLNHPGSVMLGRYSYAVFLVHTLVVRAVRDYLAPAQSTWALDHPVLTVAAVCLLILTLSVLAHHLLEQPLLKWAARQLK